MVENQMQNEMEAADHVFEGSGLNGCAMKGNLAFWVVFIWVRMV